MGVNLKDIIPKKSASLEDLKGKSLAIDAYNALYQFLAIIRQPTGEPLTDKSGRITSHLSGLLYRTSNLVETGIKPVYVFDGKPPSLKSVEIERRKTIKQQAVVKYEEALRRGSLEEARKYAQMTSKLEDYMVEDAKTLLNLLGIPWVQASSEGEAQAAYLAIKGDVWATASQDYDSLLFGAPKLVRNLTISGKRKLPGKNVYVEVNLEVIDLNQVLAELKISREQLIDVGMLIGTDFNPEGVKGIGPKTALKLVREYGAIEKIPNLPLEVFPEKPEKIREIFLKPNVTNAYKVEWKTPNVESVIKFLCGERDFSEDRVRKAVEKIRLGFSKLEAKGTLEKWF
ncbi:MAG: flap endonuclease-1 [Candidatus Bathyarchaeota archaeon]|nr:flap endonuclease-1 [Candidatus Bathyarchaeota archaeon]